MAIISISNLKFLAYCFATLKARSHLSIYHIGNLVFNNQLDKIDQNMNSLQ